MGGVVTTQSSERMWSARVVYAFGEPVPADVLEALAPEERNTEFIETLLWYEHGDNNDADLR